jgi:hypothetical protein
MWPVKPANNESAKLVIARLINEENDQYAQELRQLNGFPGIDGVIDSLDFAHKRVLKLLEKAYGEL